jgi:hypothetical protein
LPAEWTRFPSKCYGKGVSRWLVTLGRLSPVVAIASAASIVGLVAWRAVAPLEVLKASNNEVGNYLQTVGSIYAVLLAFVVYVVWGQYNDARLYVEREATALVDLHRTASGLPRATRAAIQSHLRDYVDAVLRDEWRAMAKHDDAAIERVGHQLDEVWIAIHRCRPGDICEQTMYSEVLSRFNDVSDLRTSRIASAKFRIPLTMKALLFTGAIITVGSMYLIYIPDLWLHALVTAALGGAVAHILYLIFDLDNAFAGNWQIAKTPYERARTAFERVVHLVADDECSR